MELMKNELKEDNPNLA